MISTVAKTVVCLFSAAILGTATTVTPASLDNALSSYRQNRIAEARAGFAAVLADTRSSARDHAIAARELARIEWLIDGDAAGAQAKLDSRKAWGDQACQTGALLVRVLREASRAEAALQAGEINSLRCSGDRDPLLTEIARAAGDRATETSGRRRRESLATMASVLDGLSPDGRTAPDPSRLNLELGLLSSDPQRALDGWKRYLWLVSSDLPPALRREFQSAGELFRGALSHSGTPHDEVRLIRLLVRAGFYREAKQFSRLRQSERRARTDRDWNLVSAYFKFREAVDSLAVAHNRRVAHGKHDDQAYRRGLEELMARTAADVVALDPQAPRSSTKDTLRNAWGLYGTIGLTGGYMSLHLGHVLEDVEERVAQHDRTGSVRRIVIDNMLANGYESWLWDGSAQTGGWAEAGSRLVQVRSSYLSTLLSAVKLRPGQPARVRADSELSGLAKRDSEALNKNTPADLPGLAQRLRLQAIDQILLDMTAAGAPEGDAVAFQDRYWRSLLHTSITVHEGRHVLDQQEYRGTDALSPEELEYRAKLSELQFSQHPRMALAKIVAGQIGGQSAHARANTRILTGLSKWLEDIAAAVTGFDPSRPVLSEVDKMSDAQIRSFACGSDPACR